MRTDARARSLGILAIVAAALGITAPASAQDGDGTDGPSLLLVDTDTRVKSVEFRFRGRSALDDTQLRERVATRGPRGLAGVREAFDFLPFVDGPLRPTFSPLALQKDVARLRQEYRRAGYPEVRVDYEVQLDTAENAVDVEFVIEPGQPLVIGDLDARWRNGSADGRGDASPLPAELEREWAEYVERLSASRGRALGELERDSLETETAMWLLRRGYPWARARLEPQDTTGRAVDATIVVIPGPRARVDTVRFEGHERLSREVLAREVPIGPGETYDERSVTVGEGELYELDLVTRALGEPVPGQARDSTVALRFRIDEAEPRLLWGRVGWRSEAGFAGEAHWTHRDFLGGARSLTASGLVETGWAATEQARGRSAGLSLTMRQPYLWHYQVSGTVGPFVRFRDDLRDRSILYGIATAAIYRRAPLRTATVQYELSRLRVSEALELLSISEIAERGEQDYSPVFVRSVLELHGTFGTFRDRLDPRSGFAVEPSLQITGPPGLSDVEFFRLAAEALVAVPVADWLGLFFRASAGRLFPFGESGVGGHAAQERRALVGLRGVMFTAGGTADVRGWGTGLLGPKVPDVEVGPGGAVTADRWVPVGGLARLTGGVEAALPFPFLSRSHRTFVFLDAGRVWTPGDRLEPGDPELAQEPWAFGTGVGVQIASPFGPLRLSVGYKLNPTRLDLLQAGDVARALAAGRDVSALSTEPLHRWHLHLTIGHML